MTKFCKHLIGLLLIIAALTSTAFGKEVECSVLQYKLNRLYFSTGLEKYVYPDCKYVVYRGRVVLGHGLIEFSEPGVSISYPLDYPFEGKNIERLHVVIDAVDIDSLAAIRIGAAEFKTLPVSTEFPTKDFPPLHVVPTIVPVGHAFMTNSGNRLLFNRYESLFEMELAFSGGGLDGYFSYGEPRPPVENAEFISTPANYFAALIPNVSRVFNHGGILSTAMYYRFNPDKPYVFFTGDSITVQTRLYLSDSADHRAYPYDSEAGRQLMHSVRNHPDHLALAVFDKQLQKTGAYFADILSRDKVRTRITSDWYEGDMYLCFVPLDRHDPLYSLKYVYDIVSSDTIPGMQINPTVAIIGKYIESAENAATEQIRDYYVGKVDRALKEDIGVFPLYRPTIYFIYDSHLQDYGFDPDGYLDLKSLSKITLPEIPGR